MAVEKWNPFGSDNEDVPSRRRRDPFRDLQREMNRVFEDFFDNRSSLTSRGSSASPSRRTGSFTPRLEVSEDDEELAVSAELPGMDADDVELEATEHALSLKGEKSTEWSEEDDGVVRSERSYGYFERNLPLPNDVDVESAKATFEDGVLNIRFPKTGETSGKELEIEPK